LPCAHLFGFESHYHLDESNANKDSISLFYNGKFHANRSDFQKKNNGCARNRVTMRVYSNFITREDSLTTDTVQKKKKFMSQITVSLSDIQDKSRILKGLNPKANNMPTL
jgi:hypothetical protein